MPSINDRIGSQNVIRVLSNASAPPTHLVDLTDVDSTLKTEDGMILVWDLSTEKFYMTDTIDSSSLNITGIVSFSNIIDSTAPTNGALVIDGGIGIGKAVNIGGDISVAGLSTFTSNVDINAAVDILNGLTANSTFKSVGITTLASAGGITTTGGDLYIGGDLYVADDIVYDEATARNWNISGTATVGTLLDVDGQTELDNVNISGVSTFTGAADFNGNVDIDGQTELDNVNISGIATVVTLLDLNGNLHVAGVSTFVGVATYSSSLFVAGTLTAGLIDGGTY